MFLQSCDKQTSLTIQAQRPQAQLVVEDDWQSNALRANTNSSLNPNSINSLIIEDANSILVWYWSFPLSVPFGLKILKIREKVIFS